VLRGGGHYLTPDSKILLTAFNVASGLILRVSGIVTTLDGEYSQFQKDFAIASTGAQVLNSFFAGVGWLQSIFVSVVAGTPGYNDTYAEVGIMKGTIDSRTAQVGILLAGNVSSTRTLGAPNTSSANTTLGTPSQYNINGSPGGTFTVPSGQTVIIRSIKIQYNSDATVGNRLMILTVTSAGQQGGIYTSPIVQPASFIYHYVFAPGIASDSSAALINPAIATIGYVRAGFPALHLAAADTIVFSVLNQLGSDTSTYVVLYDAFTA
jgi:hypothetical protein